MAIMSYVHEIETAYNVVQNPKMVLLSTKGAHGVSARCEKVCMLLPQCIEVVPLLQIWACLTNFGVYVPPKLPTCMHNISQSSCYVIINTIMIQLH